MNYIYLVKNIKTKEQYVGASMYPPKLAFEKLVQKSKYNDTLISQSIKTFGQEYFQFKILEEVPDARNLFKRKQSWIKTLEPELNHNELDLPNGNQIFQLWCQGKKFNDIAKETHHNFTTCMRYLREHYQISDSELIVRLLY